MKPLQLLVDTPKLIAWFALKPLRLACRRAETPPRTQQELANLVQYAVRHEIRAGYDHRFITLFFVNVGERVFCRRYTYGEPSWHSAFLRDPRGQVMLDKTIVNIDARPPSDMDDINPEIDKAYEIALTKVGGRFLMPGTVEPRAHASTLELFLSEGKAE